MKIFKPPWVTHNGKPIFSIDVHPDGSRFATAGQGDSSGRVAIWSVLPLLDVNNESNPNIPKLLCQMDNHLACVNCVRWSHSGTWLASAGDDKLIMIWRYAGGVSKTFGSEQENVETWRCVHVLRGHHGDVLDLSWAPQDQYLASCSVDNSVVIWNSQKFPEQVKLLSGHTSLVKGVTWDPIGKYLASQSDDRSIIVWRTRDWQQEISITKPFQESCGTTHVLRLAWSPDGSYMVSAHAMNNMGPTAQIVSRSGWSTDMDFVGHRKAVTCVRFNPLLLSRKIKKGNKLKNVNYCCCAVGSRDSSCSIWLTALRRPLVVLHDLFENSILDMTWNSQGTQLFLCSSDGTVAFVEFTREEIGNALTESEKNKLLTKMYGTTVMQNGTKAPQIIENADLLNIHHLTNSVSNHQRISSDAVTSNSKPMNGYHPPATPLIECSNMSATSGNKQIETKTKDGRRRITPIFLSPPPAVAEMAPPQPVFTSSNMMSSIVIEHASSDKLFDDQADKPAEITPAAALSNEKSDGSVDTEGVGIALFNAMSSHEAKSMSPKRQKKPPSESSKSKEKKANDENLPEPAKDKEVINKIAVKRKPAASSQVPASKKKKDVVEQPPPPQTTSTASPTQVPSQAPSHTLTPVLTKSLDLPAPALKKTFTYENIRDNWSITATVTNNLVLSGNTAIHKVQCTTDKSKVWSAVLSSPIADVKASRYLVCVSCKEQSLNVYNLNGHRILPPIIKDSMISKLSVNDHHCLIATCKGSLSVWDFQSMKCIINDIALSDLVSNSSLVDEVFLTVNNIPCIKLTDNSSYIYHTDLKCWLLFSQASDSVQLHSNQELSFPYFNFTDGVVSSIAHQLSCSPKTMSRVYKSEQAIQQICTLSHIENQLSLCKAMNSHSEYKAWMLTLVRYLTQTDDESALRDILTTFTSSVYKSKRSIGTGPPTDKSTTDNSIPYLQIMDLDRTGLLSDMLPIIATNLKLQRLYTEFRDLLDIMNNELA